MNKVILVGNLTRDIELKYTPSGTAIGNTGIAVTKKRKDKSGQMVEEVLFVDLTFWGRTAEIANQYLKKGSKVLIEGELKLDSWQDQNGGKRSKHSVTVQNMQMLDCKKDSAGGGSNQPQNNYVQPQSGHNQSQGNNIPPEIDINESELPF